MARVDRSIARHGAEPILTGYAESSGLPGLQVTVGEPITYQAPAALTEWPDYSGTSITLPFYRASSWSGETHDSQPFEASTEAIVLPVGLLLVALAYWFFVARAGRSGHGAASRGEREQSLVS